MQIRTSAPNNYGEDIPEGSAAVDSNHVNAFVFVSKEGVTRKRNKKKLSKGQLTQGVKMIDK